MQKEVKAMQTFSEKQIAEFMKGLAPEIKSIKKKLR
jgi:hypothetical protein